MQPPRRAQLAEFIRSNFEVTIQLQKIFYIVAIGGKDFRMLEDFERI